MREIYHLQSRVLSSYQKELNRTLDLKFLSKTDEKNIFQAYKYTKSRLMQKIPLIQASNRELCQDFNKKYKTFIKDHVLKTT